MNKKKEIQRRYGSNMSDAQYLAVGSALDDLQEHIIDKACDWMKQQVYQEYGGGPLERLVPDERIESFRKDMEE